MQVPLVKQHRPEHRLLGLQVVAERRCSGRQLSRSPSISRVSAAVTRCSLARCVETTFGPHIDLVGRTRAWAPRALRRRLQDQPRASTQPAADGTTPVGHWSPSRPCGADGRVRLARAPARSFSDASRATRGGAPGCDRRWPTGSATTPVTAPTRSTTRTPGSCSPPPPQRTERIRLGPCVAPIYMREPTYVAQLAATLDELSDGRAEVVFGIGNIAMLEQYGVEWRGTRPIARLREAHQVMRTRPRRGRDRLRRAISTATPASTTAARPVQEHLPLKIGAMGGPKSMELAGEIADGLHTACAYSPEALGYAVEHFRHRGRARWPKPGWP